MNKKQQSDSAEAFASLMKDPKVAHNDAIVEKDIRRDLQMAKDLRYWSKWIGRPEMRQSGSKVKELLLAAADAIERAARDKEEWCDYPGHIRNVLKERIKL